MRASRSKTKGHFPRLCFQSDATLRDWNLTECEISQWIGRGWQECLKETLAVPSYLPYRCGSKRYKNIIVEWIRTTLRQGLTSKRNHPRIFRQVPNTDWSAWTRFKIYTIKRKGSERTGVGIWKFWSELRKQHNGRLFSYDNQIFGRGRYIIHKFDLKEFRKGWS